jgi:hypothetical protein
MEYPWVILSLRKMTREVLSRRYHLFPILPVESKGLSSLQFLQRSSRVDLWAAHID